DGVRVLAGWPRAGAAVYGEATGRGGRRSVSDAAIRRLAPAHRDAGDRLALGPWRRSRLPLAIRSARAGRHAGGEWTRRSPEGDRDQGAELLHLRPPPAVRRPGAAEGRLQARAVGHRPGRAARRAAP